MKKFIAIILVVFSLSLSSLAHGSYAPLPAMHIKIPSIKVNAVVESVGITSNGSMDVPAKPEDTAWFNMGTHIGDVGSAVVDGHSGYKNNKPAVFDNLYKIKVGNKIYVTDSKGTSTAFVVKQIQAYNPNSNAKSVFFSNDKIAHLNLITCSGLWNPITKTHSERLVVFSDKI